MCYIDCQISLLEVIFDINIFVSSDVCPPLYTVENIFVLTFTDRISFDDEQSYIFNTLYFLNSGILPRDLLRSILIESYSYHFPCS